MAPRKRVKVADDDNVRQEIGIPDVQQQPNERDRRGDMAQIARRRAAHFANFKDDDDIQNGEDNVHVGTDDARTLGPWSSAVQLVNEREKAITAREDKIAKRKAEIADTASLVEWEASRDVSLGPRPRDHVPPLMQLCVDLVVQHIEVVETFVGLPDAIRVQISKAVAAQRKMSPQVANLLVDGTCTEVDVPDCTQLDAVSMKTFVQTCACESLERVELGSCGRGFGDEAAAALGRGGPYSNLKRLKLGGAYRLTDEGLVSLLTAAPHLTHLSLTDANRLTGAFLQRLPALCSTVTLLDLSNCRGLDADSLGFSLQQLPALHTLSLRGVVEVGDGVLSKLSSAPCLRHLDIGCCKAVTDKGVETLVARGGVMQGLVLDECPLLSDRCLLSIAASCKNLAVLSARRCTKFSDSGLAAVAENGALQQLLCSNVPGLGALTMSSLALHCKDSLEQLDVSFCRNVPEKAFGLVADSCQKLQVLTVFGCTQISKLFVYGHSNDGLEVLGLHPLN